MSHFYGVIQTSARQTQPTARGHKNTGLGISAQSWEGQISTFIYYDEETKKDKFRVERKPHGSCTNQDTVILASGFLDMSEIWVQKTETK